jgi:hypothetical protein
VTAWLTVSFLSATLAVVTGWLIPVCAMRRLVPSLESGGKRVSNFRGASIPTGLGIVWLVWAAALAIGYAFVAFALNLYLAENAFRGPWFPAVYSTPWTQASEVLIILALGATALGMVDDLFGDSSAKGFRGHIRALLHGRLTTGGLKMLGIGALAVLAGLPASRYAAGQFSQAWPVPQFVAVAAWVCASLVIALCANLVNLSDLRPGRALKSYSVLSVLGIGISVAAMWAARSGTMASDGGLPSPGLQRVWIACMAVTLLALALGPSVAVWRFDLGERAMLGDAGANAMGAIAGFMLAWQSPLWLLAVMVVVLLALNLVSERVSFTKVIERTVFLRWLDGLGRLPSDASG